MRDAWQTVGFVVVAVAASLLIAKGPPYRTMDALGLGIAVVAAGCLLWRRSAPLTVLTADAVLVVVNSAAGYSPTVVPWATWIAVLEVVNEGSALVAGQHGRGLANMRERARRAGGECEAGPFEGGFRVRATLPAAR